MIDALGCWSNGEALLKKSITNAHFEFLTLPFCFRVCYDRCRYYPTIATFIISAMWHGVYPGYYMTFLTAIPITLAARAIRNNTRIYFIKTKSVKLFYDFITWIATMIAISYTVVPFVLLSVEPSLKFYRSWYYCLHIIPLLIMLVLPIKSRRKESEQNHSKLKRLEVENTSTSNNYAALNNNLDQIRRPSWTQSAFEWKIYQYCKITIYLQICMGVNWPLAS